MAGGLAIGEGDLGDNRGCMLKLKDVIDELMNDRLQASRPIKQRGRFTLSRGLRLWFKRVGPGQVLSATREDVAPSDEEMQALVNAIIDPERPNVSLVFFTMDVTIHPVSDGSVSYYTRYLYWFRERLHVAYPPEVKQRPLFE